ncbi:MAG: VCBS repeat-containing protein [Planctomycetes bacterium]|nr:VCBS repeat-containing protein [Planctomycetota bacterium]
MVFVAHFLALSVVGGDGSTCSVDHAGAEFGCALRASVVLAGDVDADGRPDLVVFDDDQTSSSVVVALHRPNGAFTLSTPSMLQSVVEDAELCDVDRDGRLDVLTSGPNVGVAFARGDGHGCFVPSGAFGVAGRVLAIGDFDHDDAIDVAVTAIDELQVYRGDGAGTFTPTVSLTTPPIPADVEVADCNRDGHLDIVVLDGPRLSWHAGDGSGGFRAPVHSWFGSALLAEFELGDVDQDGFVDAAVRSKFDGVVYFLSGSASGRFTLESSVTVSPFAAKASLADVDRDGWLDYVWNAGASCGVRFGAGAWTFVEEARAIGVGSVHRPIVHDVDGDRLPDLVLAHAVTRSLAFVTQSSSRRFVSPRATKLTHSFDHVTSGDFDGDGDLDLAVSQVQYGGTTLLENDGFGDFVSTWHAWSSDRGVRAAADLQGDGRADLLCLDSSLKNLRVRLASGAGGFEPATDSPLPFEGSDFQLGDLDGDGHVDAVVLSSGFGGLGRLMTMQGDAYGLFAPNEVHAVPESSYSAQLGDFDSDGHVDVAVRRRSPGVDEVRTWRNDGGGRLAPWTTWPAHQNQPSFAVGDVDGDHALDFVHFGSGMLTVARGNGHGSFSELPSTSAPDLNELRLADVDGDGCSDVVLSGNQGLAVLRARRDGRFDPPRSYRAGSAKYALAADVTGDGVVELACQSAVTELAVLRGVDAAPTTYCTAKVDSAGCEPRVHGSGCPSLGADAHFLVVAQALRNHVAGTFWFGPRALDVPFLGGRLCVGGPSDRIHLGDAGGSAHGVDCSGAFSFDFGAYFAEHASPSFGPGDEVFVQLWYRDPDGGEGAGSSAGLRFTLRL